MTHLAVELAYESRLAAWAAAHTPRLRIAYENDQFMPAAGEIYLRAFILPSDTGSDDLKGSHRRYQGLFQVNIVGPVGGGSGGIKHIVSELESLFPVNLRLPIAGNFVQIVEPVKQGPAITEDSTYTVSATFVYRADVNLAVPT